MRVLVTGAAGQLGRDLAAHLVASGDEVVGVDRAEADLVRRDDTLGVIGHVRPDVVIHTAAMTAVDACEELVDTAFAVNALAVRNVAEGCARFGAHLVHLSTDYVFDGTKPAPYHEWDEPNPRSVYGASKLAGEREAAAVGATIVRTSWVAGFHGANIVKTVLRLAAGDGPLRFVDDQRGHPTFTDDLAVALRRLAVDRRPGLHHVTNQGAVSWYEFVREVLACAGADPDRVEPIATADLDPPRAAARPANSVLDNAVLRLSGLPLLDDFRVPLARLVRRLQAS